MHELNLDPRFRVAAGFGTAVVQETQEVYMNAAWEQVGDVLEANRRIRYAPARRRRQRCRGTAAPLSAAGDATARTCLTARAPARAAAEATTGGTG